MPGTHTRASVHNSLPQLARHSLHGFNVPVNHFDLLEPHHIVTKQVASLSYAVGDNA